MKEAILAYTAGIIDGEGYIGIVMGCKNYLQRELRVHMKHSEIPKFLLKQWGGKFYINRKQGTYYWTANTTKGDKVLKEILPYLVEKKQQALLFIKAGKLAHASYHNGPDTLKQKSEKHKLYLQLKEMHN